MSSHPTFSILTPVYNVEKFLPACIESVLAQTLTDWELILVNDGSTDSSGKICDEYAAKYPGKILVFHNTNHGQLYTRNFALSKASGTYYIFLDSDDLLTSNALEIIYNKFKEYQCDCVIYGLNQILPNGKIINTTKDKEIYFTDKRLLYRLIFLNNVYNPVCRKAVKSELITPIDYSPYYHISHGEDLLQSLEILHNCRSVALIPDILYHYTQNTQSITHTLASQPLQLSFEVREKVLGFLEKEQIFTQQDIQDYHRYCIQIFEGQLKEVCVHPASYNDKIRLFQQVKKQRYYTDFLASPNFTQPIKPIYTQFRLGLYPLLLLEMKMYSFVKRWLTTHL